MKRMISILFICTLFAGCDRSELDMALHELDCVIDDRDKYNDRLNDEINLYRDSLYNAVSLSDKYRLSNELFRCYHAENADSAIYYAELSRIYAEESRNEVQILLSAFNRILIPSATDIERCRVEYESFDEKYIKENFGHDILLSYLYCGAELYKFLSINTGKDKDLIKDRYDYYRIRYCEENPGSVTAVRFTVGLLNSQGRHAESLAILFDFIEGRELDYYEKSILYNNIGSTYSGLSDGKNARIWYARSAVYNLMRPAKQYHSLPVLALLLLEDGDYEHALKYINVAAYDALSSNYDFRISETSSYMLAVSALAKKNESMRRLSLIIILIVLALFILIISVVLILLLRYSRRLKESYYIINETNSQLTDLNRIKENFLLKYMIDCTDYIKAIDENNSNLRKILKQGGIDELKSELRKPKYSSKEFKRFYHEFDNTFLKMFPYFVDEVNKIMPEGSKFPACSDGNLTMDLRIMAVIRIGIRNSGEIASFLNYAPSTVYTSRTKVKKASVLDGDDFDEYIQKIGI